MVIRIKNTIPYANEQNESKNGNNINTTFIILSEKLIDLYEKKIIFLEEEVRKLKKNRKKSLRFIINKNL